MRHGGDLAAAAAAFGRPPLGWLDLSTGVNPHAYPLKPFSAGALTRLPDPADLDALLAIAREAYSWRHDMPVAAGGGAQAMIQLLPYLRPRGAVVVIGRTYAEHAFVWARAGHQVREAWSLAGVEDARVVIVVNPDNPTGRTIDADVLASLGRDLARRGGLLVVDESFADVSPDIALGSRLATEGVVALRSFGKFYGLPGLRLGFAAGDAETVRELVGELGPWPVNGPAIEAARTALADRDWADAMRARLARETARLDAALIAAGLKNPCGCALFRTVRHPQAALIHERLARKGVWCRSFEERPDQLRFGLPADDAAFGRLEAALSGAILTAA